MATKRVFIAFAIEDVRYRDLLKGQEINDRTPIEYIDMSAKEPWSSDWKEKVRTRIKGCHGVIALLSRNSLTATGQRFEIRCAKEERIPLLGVYIHADDLSSPPEMDGVPKIKWTWDGIAAFIAAP